MRRGDLGNEEPRPHRDYVHQKNKHRDEEEASKATSMFLIAFVLLSAELEACKTIDPLTSNRRNAEEKKCSTNPTTRIVFG